MSARAFAPADYARLREACELHIRALAIEAAVYDRQGWRQTARASNARRAYYEKAALTYEALSVPATKETNP